MITQPSPTKNRLVATLTITALVIFIPVIVWVVRLSTQASAILEVIVAPASAVIDINGQTFENGTHKFRPGTYEVSITKTGFISYNSTLTLTQNQTTQLYAYLLEESGGYQWYLDHPDDAMLLNTIGDHQADIKAQDYVESDPILAITPFYDLKNRFQITALKQNSTTIIRVSLNTCDPISADLYETAALEWLQQQQVDLSKYTLNYTTLCDQAS